MPPAIHTTFWSELPWLDIIAAEDVSPDHFAYIEWQTQKGRLRLLVCASRNTVSVSVECGGMRFFTTNRIAGARYLVSSR